MRRVGALMTFAADDNVATVRNAAFLQGLERAGWTVGRNLRIEYRWAGGSADAQRKHAEELVALAPDVILATGSAATAPLLRLTRSIPVVFVHIPDPVGAGHVDSLARPGGNATGFTTFEYSIGGKWLTLLKEVAPNLARAAVIRDPAITAGIGQWGAIHAVAPSIGTEVVPVNVSDAAELQRTMEAFARSPNGGLIVTGSGLAVVRLGLIIELAARHKLPAVYYERSFVTAGGLISYGPDITDQYRQAAGYVDRILRGEKPAELPVQAASKFETVINLKTAKALGLDSAADASRPRRRGDRMRAARVHLAARWHGSLFRCLPRSARAQQSTKIPAYRHHRRLARSGTPSGRACGTSATWKARTSPSSIAMPTGCPIGWPRSRSSWSAVRWTSSRRTVRRRPSRPSRRPRRSPSS